MAGCYLCRFKPLLGVLVPGANHQTSFPANSLRNRPSAAALSHTWDSYELQSPNSWGSGSLRKACVQQGPVSTTDELSAFVYLTFTHWGLRSL